MLWSTYLVRRTPTTQRMNVGAYQHCEIGWLVVVKSHLLNPVLQYATVSLHCRTRTTLLSIQSISDNNILRSPACSPAVIWPTRLSPVSRDLELAVSVSVLRRLRPAPSTVPTIWVRTRLGRTRVFGRFPLPHSLCSSPLFSAQDAAGRVSGLALPHSRWCCSPSGFTLVLPGDEGGLFSIESIPLFAPQVSSPSSLSSVSLY